MDEDRFVISNELWEKIAPMLPGKAGDPGATGHHNRLFMEHATAVVTEVTQCLAKFRLASPLSYQIPEGIYHFVDTVGIVAKNMALRLKPFGTGLFIGPKSDIRSTLELLCGMPEIEHLLIGIEAFGKRPIALLTICGDHQFQVRIFGSVNGPDLGGFVF